MCRLPVASALHPQAYTSKHYLSKSGGKWGVMEERVWDGFVGFLHSSGLLTTKVQSRTAGGEFTTTLDGLRQVRLGPHAA